MGRKNGIIAISFTRSIAPWTFSTDGVDLPIFAQRRLGDLRAACIWKPYPALQSFGSKIEFYRTVQRHADEALQQDAAKSAAIGNHDLRSVVL